MASDAPQGGGLANPGGLRLGSWNLSHWSVDRVESIATRSDLDLMDIQETHLAQVPLEKAHTTAAHHHLHLHHGRPSQPLARSVHGRSCGVGFLARRGLALSLARPVGPAWRLLHAMGRLHAVRLGPFPTLPHGLLIVSIYAPLQEHGQATLRERFVNAFQEFSHVLDMQVPTLLVGDFNGSLIPAYDFAHTSTQRRHPCPLLSHLLGPGGAWLDVHAALLPPPLPWTYQNTDSQGTVSASRIDLILANHAAFPYLTNPRVLTHISDGGHMPVAVDIQLGCSVRIDWHPPRPRLPPLLRLPSSALRSSPEWNDLMDRWLRSPEVMLLFGPSPPTSADTLSQAMQAALQRLITLAGGWQRRPPQRRLAFDSIAVRRLRHRLSLLQRLLSLVNPAATSTSPPVGSWPHQWLMLLADLQRAGLSLPTPSLSVSDLLSSLRSAAQVDRCSLDRLLSEMRKERHLRWKTTLPSLWHTRPGVINQWLHATGASWGSVPILDADGFQCTSPCAIDTAVRLFWVDTILRQHASVDPVACWKPWRQATPRPSTLGIAWHMPMHNLLCGFAVMSSWSRQKWSLGSAVWRC